MAVSIGTPRLRCSSSSRVPSLRDVSRIARWCPPPQPAEALLWARARRCQRPEPLLLRRHTRAATDKLLRRRSLRGWIGHETDEEERARILFADEENEGAIENKLRERHQPHADPGCRGRARAAFIRSEEHTSELQSRENLVCRLLLEKK